MYCNNCGAANQIAKTYCRHCGKWIGSAPPEERLIVMIVFNALSAVFAAASAIALFVTYLGKPSALWSIYLAATFCLIIAVYQTLSFFFALNLRYRLKLGQKDVSALNEHHETNELPPADTAHLVGLASITENTTEMLERKSR